MKKQERITKILEQLDEHYSVQKKCWLDYDNAWQLLFATILSAQCTDARVNLVTKDLYVKYPNIEAFAKADLKELEQDIHSTGFYHNKAKNLIACANQLLDEYNGQVPSDIDQLTKLAGVGRKTANVIRGNIYDIPSIVVDTHVGRISRKLGLTKHCAQSEMRRMLFSTVLPGKEKIKNKSYYAISDPSRAGAVRRGYHN